MRCSQTGAVEPPSALDRWCTHDVQGFPLPPFKLPLSFSMPFWNPSFRCWRCFRIILVPRFTPKLFLFMSTRIKDAGIAIRRSQGYIISILQGLEMGCNGLPTGSRGPKIKKKGSQMSKNGFCPKAKSPKMGLPITPRHFL